MLIQLFAFAFCVTAVGVALMVQQLPEHRRARVEAALAHAPEPEASPEARRNPCEGYRGKSLVRCRSAMARAGMDIDEGPHEEPALD